LGFEGGGAELTRVWTSEGSGEREREREREHEGEMMRGEGMRV
jgi:hypothetical protein